MPVHIQVEQIGDTEFQVQLIEGSTRTFHRVTLRAKDCHRLSNGKTDSQELVRRSFEFLLEHEPKESILAKFDLMEIARYFPSFESEIQRRLLKA